VTMRLFYEALWLQKAGNSEEEYEDAFWPKPRLSGEPIQVVSVAVADGATDSSFSGIWARQLVRAYSHGNIDPANIKASLSKIQARWARTVNRKPLPWYAEEKLRKGAFSTLLGVTLRDEHHGGSSGTWEALAVGDTCLAHVRGDELVATFPLSSSTQFNNTPFLLCSNPNSNTRLDVEAQFSSGAWETGDSFYLMTDAFAAWFFREVEEGAKPWQILRDVEIDPSVPFRPWIEELRRKNAIRNDDVTLYRIDVS